MNPHPMTLEQENAALREEVKRLRALIKTAFTRSISAQGNIIKMTEELGVEVKEWSEIAEALTDKDPHTESVGAYLARRKKEKEL